MLPSPPIFIAKTYWNNFDEIVTYKPNKVQYFDFCYNILLGDIKLFILH